MAIDAQGKVELVVAQANLRLTELGYSSREARAQAVEDGVRLSGTLIAETEVVEHGVYPVLAMLPPKDRLLAIRRALPRGVRATSRPAR